MFVLKGVARKAVDAYGGKLSFAEAFSSASVGGCQAVRSYRPRRGATLATWIRRRAAGQIIDDLRQFHGRDGRKTSVLKRTRASLDAMNDQMGDGVCSALAVLDERLAVVDDDEAFSVLARRLAGGNAMFLRALYLHYWCAMSRTAAAAQCGRSESWFSLTMQKARRRLLGELQREKETRSTAAA